MKASKVAINILLTPLALVAMLLVAVVCAISTVARAVLSAPYGIFNGLAMGCQTMLRSFVEGYERGRDKVLGEVSHNVSKS